MSSCRVHQLANFVIPYFVPILVPPGVGHEVCEVLAIGDNAISIKLRIMPFYEIYFIRA